MLDASIRTGDQKVSQKEDPKKPKQHFAAAKIVDRQLLKGADTSVRCPQVKLWIMSRHKSYGKNEAVNDYRQNCLKLVHNSTGDKSRTQDHYHFHSIIASAYAITTISS